MKLFANDSLSRAVDGHRTQNMKSVPLFFLLAAFLIADAPCRPLLAAENEGIALAIIYDTSGSMRDPVRDRAGHTSPKYVIANRALVAIAQQLQKASTNSSGAPRKIEVGLFTFAPKGLGAKEVVPFGPFDAAAIIAWANSFDRPAGNTPLGAALKHAAEKVLGSSLNHKHVLVITDGENTAGPDPAAVIPQLRRQAQAQQTSLSLHFVAFDVNAKVFEPVKKLDATVVSASDETQLNTQLNYILQRKILLEDEEKK
jgi:uncharacterized protein YegL